MTTRTTLPGRSATLAAESDYQQMSTLQLIDALEFETSRNPDLSEGLIWEVVGRLARAEQSAIS
jgi:hypothetical protein